MHAFLAATAFVLTVTSSVAFGIAAGYALILGWLRLFGRTAAAPLPKAAEISFTASGD